jgi:hypothetical protein
LKNKETGDENVRNFFNDERVKILYTGHLLTPHIDEKAEV